MEKRAEVPCSSANSRRKNSEWRRKVSLEYNGLHCWQQVLQGLLTFRIERGAQARGLAVWPLALCPYFLRDHVTDCHWREPGWVCLPLQPGCVIPIALETCTSLSLDNEWILSFLCSSQGRGVQGPDPSFSPVHPQDLACAWNLVGICYYLLNEAWQLC